MYVERAKDWLFDFIGYGHVIFDGVQPSQYEIEYAYLGNFKN